MNRSISELYIKNETPNELVLETSIEHRKIPVFKYLVWIVFAIVLSTLGYMYIHKTLGWLGFFLSGCLIIYVIYSSITTSTRNKTVVIDLDKGKVTFEKTMLWRSPETIELAMDQVGQITIFTVDYSPMPPEKWDSVTTLNRKDDLGYQVVNSGQRQAMQLFAEKLSQFIGKSVEEKIVSTTREFPK